jgi:hypothetical protein
MPRYYGVLLALLLYITSIVLQFSTGFIILSPGTDLIYVVFIIIGILPVLEFFFTDNFKIFRFYPLSIFILANIVLIITTFSNFPVFALEVFTVILCIRYIYYEDKQRIYNFIYIFYGFAMMLISSLLRFSIHNIHPNMYIFNSGDDVRPGGVPLFFQNGIVLSGPRYVLLTISIQYLLVILVIGFLLIENTRGIIKLARMRQDGTGIKSQTLSVTSTTFSLFSCQCETTTSIVPAIGSEILGIVSVPIVFESLALSLGTFIVIQILSRHRNIGFLREQWNRTSISINKILLLSALIIASPIVITTGIYLGYLHNLLFYFGTNLSMFAIATFVFLTVFQYSKITLKFNRPMYAILSIIATALMVIWYIPSILTITVEFGYIFSIMGISSILAGLIIAIMLSGVEKLQRAVIFEYIAGMFPVIFVIVLYYSVVTGSQIWAQFSIIDQLEFSLLLLGVTLPFMWYATNYSIYGNYSMQSQ